jgi:hypothetical protein
MLFRIRRKEVSFDVQMAASVLLTIDPKTALKSTLLRFRIRRKEVSFDGRMVAPDSHLL